MSDPLESTTAPLPIPAANNATTTSSPLNPSAASTNPSAPANFPSHPSPSPSNPAGAGAGTLESQRNTTTSPPLDPSKLNQSLAPLPAPSTGPAGSGPSGPADPSAPLRSPESGPHDSAYLDTGSSESPSHPTIAETGALSQSASDGPGPRQGQLKRVEKGSPGSQPREIIKLGSFGGEGLVMKPAVGSPVKEGEGGFGAIASAQEGREGAK